MNILLSVQNLSFSYDNKEMLLNNISLELNKGEAIGITGPSGCGKSTLCYILSGIIPHVYGGFLEGSILVSQKNTINTPLHELSRSIGIVFQSPDIQLFSSEVEHDVAFGPENLCLKWEEIADSVNNSMNITGIRHKRRQNPKTLSGGEAQLAALSSVLAMNPDIIIFDEAMSSLDEKGVEQVQNIVKTLKERGKSLILIDHNTDRFTHADKIFELKKGALY